MALIRRAVAMMAGTAAIAAAQTPAQLKLKPADAQLAEEFTMIGSVRELADGRVLVTDLRDNRLLVADLKAGTTRLVGRIGSGPGEYRRTGRLNLLGGDSTLMQDGGNRRWIVLHGDSIVITMPPESPAIRASLNVASSDRHGRVQTAAFVRPAPNQPPVDGESAFVLLVQRSTGEVDTIARLAPMWREVEREGTAAGSSRIGSIRSRALDGAEQALLMSDGWTAIIRLNPYRVDWRGPAGLMVRGAPLPVPLLPVDDKVKQAYVHRFPPRAGRGPVEVSQIRDWAAYVAPVLTFGSLLELPDGKALIHRQNVGANEPTRYDIVDRRGNLTAQLSMASGERVVGFGQRALYVAIKDSDDIERIRRHPWP
jgi:hypothetical protein